MEQNLLQLCCYFPTTVIFVDDNQKYLVNIRGCLDSHQGIYNLYNNPIAALNYLTESYKSDPFINRCMSRPEEEYANHRNLEINIHSIHEEIYNPERFKEVALLIVDYAMPEMNGLDFLRRVPKMIKRVLLTGEADEKTAINAFNNDLIDRYLRKDDENFTEKLKSIIREQQKNYFQSLSDTIVTTITKNTDYPLSCLDDPVFVNFFNGLIRSNNIVEYYLLDAAGSYLLIDKNGNLSWIAVADEQAMQSYYELAKDDDAEDRIIQALATKQKLPFFFTEQDFQVRPADWYPYLYPANQLSGKTSYYYSYIRKLDKFRTNSREIVPFVSVSLT